jgi:hypothetical protein
LNRLEYAPAIADLQEAVRLDPHASSACFVLAYLFTSCPQTELCDLEKAREYARMGCEPLEPKERESYEIRTRQFAMPVRIDPGRRDEIETIRLYVSEDEGKTWTYKKELKPTDNSVNYWASHDGLYWFAIQPVLKNEKCSPAKPDDLVPAMKVYVNTEGRALKFPESHDELQREVEQLRKTVQQLQEKIEQLKSERKAE